MNAVEEIDLGYSASPRLGGENTWLFSRNIDLTVFLGSAIASLLLLAIGWQLGILNSDSPDWTWISAVLLIDVAHVWSTSFRVYFDTEELNQCVGIVDGTGIDAHRHAVYVLSSGDAKPGR